MAAAVNNPLELLDLSFDIADIANKRGGWYNFIQLEIFNCLFTFDYALKLILSSASSFLEYSNNVS